MRGPCRPAVFASVLCLACLVGEALGYGGGVLQVPAPSAVDGSVLYSGRTGLNITVDTRWYDDGGYRPVRVRLTSANGAAVDRQILVVLEFLNPSNRNGSQMEVRREFTLPAGSQTIEQVVLCPGLGEWGGVEWRVEVDGQEDPSLSTLQQGWLSLAPSQRSPEFRVLEPRVVSRGQASTGELALAGERSYTAIGGRRRGRVPSDHAECERFDHWLAYTSADVLVYDLAELRTLADEHPDGLRAVRNWLLAGGTVWVERAGVKAETYREIDTLLAVDGWRFVATADEREPEDDSARAKADEQAGGADQPAGTPSEGLQEEDAEASTDESEAGSDPYQPPQDKAGLNRDPTPVEGAEGWGYHPLLQAEQPGNLANQLSGPQAQQRFQELIQKGLLGMGQGIPSDSRGWYAERRVGFGRVMAFNRRATDMPDSPFSRDIARETFGRWRTHNWGSRHGVEPGGSSPEFGNLLVPGVGVAPVNEFQVLITLFVLAIGPLNYWLLWRRQQLQMLVVTTPLCALAVTLGLVAYASVADGFGVKARARSVTLLDQKSGEAVSWSRVSHYIASTPAAPAVLPADTAAYPITPTWESAIAMTSTRRALDWVGDRQRLTSGWTPSRTAVQNLMIRCRKTEARVEFAGRGDSLRAANRLGAPIELLIVRDEAGDGEPDDGESDEGSTGAPTTATWSRIEGLAPGDDERLEPVSRLEAMQAFRQLSIDNLPEFPVGAGKAVEETMERLGNSRDIRRLQRSMAAARLSDNLANDLLDSLTGLDGGRGLDVPPRTYIAVTKQAVETPLLWDDVQEVGSYHVLVGRW